MTDNLACLGRDAHQTQAWLIGCGIASLAAAVHLINRAKLPGSNIHILDLHSRAGGGMNPFGGNAEGYFLPFDWHPHFYGSNIERLLSLVPGKALPGQSLMDAVRFFDKFERPQPQTTALTRALREGEKGPEIVYTQGIHIGIKNRLALVRMMLDKEKYLGSKRISDVLDKSFFDTTFWMLWATA